MLFLQGGASLQFSMIPMNLLSEGASADYVITGSWGKKASRRRRSRATTVVAADMADSRYIAHARRRTSSSSTLRPPTSTSPRTRPSRASSSSASREVGDVPLVCDASSNICSRPVDVQSTALIYAGAQKNLGPSGVTLVIIRDDLLATRPRRPPHDARLPHARREQVALQHAEHLGHLHPQPRLRVGCKDAGRPRRRCAQRERREGAARSTTASTPTDFYRGHAVRRRALAHERHLPPALRRAGEEASPPRPPPQGLDGLKGHRSVGGIRASIYNAFPREGVEALVANSCASSNAPTANAAHSAPRYRRAVRRQHARRSSVDFRRQAFHANEVSFRIPRGSGEPLRGRGTQGGEDFDGAPGVREGFRLPALPGEGLGEAVAVAGDQLLAADFFGQGQGLAGQGFRAGPVLAVQRQRGQIAGDRWRCLRDNRRPGRSAGPRGSRARRRRDRRRVFRHRRGHSGRWRHLRSRGSRCAKAPRLRERPRWRQGNPWPIGARCRASGWRRPVRGHRLGPRASGPRRGRRRRALPPTVRADSGPSRHR